MTRQKVSWLGRARRAAGREDGTVTVEFVILFPMFVSLLLMSFEAGMLMTRFIMLERALDITVRDIRIGNYEFPTPANATEAHDMVKADICARSILMPNCMQDLMLEMRPVNRTTWAGMDASPDCIERGEPLGEVSFAPGAQNQLMLIRACAVFDPFFPTTRFGLRLRLDPSGGYQMAAMSAFVNEP
ncbi:MAG: TadE/TadG family type IV pilus assembly protein [Gemmobacter sp.]|nr:TadE/TadG family type IV pilus assembly protein [Gemmobacter sp.]